MKLDTVSIVRCGERGLLITQEYYKQKGNY